VNIGQWDAGTVTGQFGKGAQESLQETCQEGEGNEAIRGGNIMKGIKREELLEKRRKGARSVLVERNDEEKWDCLSIV